MIRLDHKKDYALSEMERAFLLAGQWAHVPEDALVSAIRESSYIRTSGRPSPAPFREPASPLKGRVIPSSKEDALRTGERYFLGKECPSGHTIRMARNNQCYVCKLEQQSKRRTNTPEWAGRQARGWANTGKRKYSENQYCCPEDVALHLLEVFGVLCPVCRSPVLEGQRVGQYALALPSLLTMGAPGRTGGKSYKLKPHNGMATHEWCKSWAAALETRSLEKALSLLSKPDRVKNIMPPEGGRPLLRFDPELPTSGQFTPLENRRRSRVRNLSAAEHARRHAKLKRAGVSQ